MTEPDDVDLEKVRLIDEVGEEEMPIAEVLENIARVLPEIIMRSCAR